MRTAFVFCNGIDERINHICQLLGGTDIVRDVHPARSPRDHFVSFRVDLDRLGNGIEIDSNATNTDIIELLRRWAYAEDVSPGLDVYSGELSIDHITSFSSYEDEWGSDIDLRNEDALTPEQLDLVNSHATRRREVFHNNDANDDDDYGDGDGEGDSEDDDEHVEQFHTTNDDDGVDDDENVVYDADDPLE